MLIDAPGVEDVDPKNKGCDIVLTDDNADQVLAMINRINR
jgi:hypothetical protein|nr:MAG TPA: hypothetical protein [Caudoviricetes sp.]